MTRKPTLLFISPQFLFPMDAGGKIRSANILKRLKGGAFSTRLLTPVTADEEGRWRSELDTLADEAIFWRPSPRNVSWAMRRAMGFFTQAPISAFCDANERAKSAVAAALGDKPDLVVFDYVQSLAMAPDPIAAPHVFFAHNVETEILERRAALAKGVMKSILQHEAAKMRRFERRACESSDAVIAVSERDAARFRSDYAAKRAYAIPTGVDPDYFRFAPLGDDAPPRIVFTGSMDWKANQDGLFWFMDEIWPLIAAGRADASFVVIGKNPPTSMVETARSRGLNWRFTGFVDDVRDHARGTVFVIPLRIGGGTRIKAFEAMAMGTPVVSTALGVEGLSVSPEEHFLEGNDAPAFAGAVSRLLDDHALRVRLAGGARRLVEENFSHQAAAKAFEQKCLAVLGAVR